MNDSTKSNGVWCSHTAMAVARLLAKAQDDEAGGNVAGRVKISKFARMAGVDMPADLAVDLLELLAGVGYKLYDNASVDGLTRSERNAGVALSLYAVAPRGSYGETGKSMGAALADLRATDSRWSQEPASFEGVLTPILRADSKEALVWGLKNAMRRVDPEKVKIDYPLLADDLTRFDKGEKVVVRWARDYYAQDYSNHSTKGTEDSKEN